MLSGRISRNRARRDGKRRGAAMLELAVALPLLMLICVGVMDFGRVYFTSVAVANAARAGAEWGSTPEPGYAFNGAKQRSFALLDGNEFAPITLASSTVCRCGGTATVSCVSTPVCTNYGEPRVFVTVKASKSVALFLRYPGIPTTVTVADSATFRAQ